MAGTPVKFGGIMLFVLAIVIMMSDTFRDRVPSTPTKPVEARKFSPSTVEDSNLKNLESLGILEALKSSPSTVEDSNRKNLESLGILEARKSSPSTVEDSNLKNLESLGIRIKPESEWYLGVCTGTKSSVAWIQEWIELQIIAGVDHLWIVNDNDETTEDGTQKVLEFYERLGFVTIIPGSMPKTHPGCQIYPDHKGGKGVKPHNCAAPKHCAEFVGTRVQWLLFADTDEFMYPHKGCSLADYVKNTCNPNQAAIKIRWERFGASGFHLQPSGLMTENFLSSGGDCSALTSQNYNSWQETCQASRFSFCSECRHFKMLFNTGKCLTIDHMGWIHYITNTSWWKRRKARSWVNRSPGPATLPFRDPACYENHHDTKKCDAWLATVPQGNDPIDFTAKCCAAGIGYNHYGTKALQYYFRKQKRAGLDLRGWRVMLDAIDLNDVISFSVLRFVRALRARFTHLGLPTALGNSFVDLRYEKNGKTLNGTCFEEADHRYIANPKAGTSEVQVKMSTASSRACCIECLQGKGCKGWTQRGDNCVLLVPSETSVIAGQKGDRIQFPRQYLPASRKVVAGFTSGLVLSDECHVQQKKKG
ncbi:hypothetical protein DIPPA_04743 [Diplonema papillatum]|nr:hypothetical protein DIPPA_04743 [Diplonema papillatum]